MGIKAEKTALQHPKYRSDIDGLRAIAVLAVVAYHAFPGRMSGGFVGVDIFFVISGFLISRIIFQNLESQSFSFGEFYQRRIRRIFPALITVLFAVLVGGWFLLTSDEITQLGKHVAAGALFINNFVLLNESGYFDSSFETKPLLHLWSLGIEEQFYIVWPLLVWAIWKFKINMITFALLLACLSLYLNVSGVAVDPIGTFYYPHTRFWELLGGGMLAWLDVYAKKSELKTKLLFDRAIKKVLYRNPMALDGQTSSNLLAATGLMLLAYSFFKFNKNLLYPGFYALVPVLGTMFMIYAGPHAWINRFLLSNRILVWFGLISFPLYLWHWPLISFSWIVEGGAPSTFILSTAVMLAIFLAWLTTIFVETPFRFSKNKIKVKVLILCLWLAALGLAGLILNKTNVSSSRDFEDLAISRKGAEFAYGSSLKWYQGRKNWLYLGNYYEDSVAKLKLAILPTKQEIKASTDLYTHLANTASKYGTKMGLIVGPNKESVYPEYLPVGLTPSPIRYSDFFLNELKKIPNLTVYDPTKDLIKLKKIEGLLYWKTDTHWNSKGAFFGFQGFLNQFLIPVPDVQFVRGFPHRGDLLDLAGINSYPLNYNDDWQSVWVNPPKWEQTILTAGSNSFIDQAEMVINKKPLSRKVIWVIGDSFTDSMREYFNGTFSKVVYLGHWAERLEGLPENLDKAPEKPDIVVIVKVERSF